MTIKASVTFFLAFVISMAAAVPAIGGDDIEAAIQSVVVKNLKSTQAEDLDAMMGTIHSQSPGYLTTKQQVAPLFENFDLKYDLLSFKYIGRDQDYAIARVKQATSKIAGPAFQNNEMDLIHVFREENGEWKFWNQVILEIKFLNE